MRKPHTLLRTNAGDLPIGEIPRVVGTLSSLYESVDLADVCDIIEVRLDELSHGTQWIDRCQAIESTGTPIVLTMRLQSEGGKWTAEDSDRFPLFEQALQNLSCVDVELKSELAESVCQMAQHYGKSCIVSYHDFQKTPSLDALESIAADAERLASIVKISTMVNSEGDIDTLKRLLLRTRKVPLCVIGMGASGTHTRLAFATLGSCMTYGYLDKPSAPGQLPAYRLVESLRATVCRYNEDFVIRKQILEFA